MSVSAGDYAFLTKDWRWAEVSDSAIKTKYSGAREADRPSALIDGAGATAVVTAIHGLLSADNRFIMVTVDGILALTFKTRPPTVTLYYSRYGLSGGRKMAVSRADFDWSRETTTLYLFG